MGFGRDIAIGHDSRSSSQALKAILLSTSLENGANLKDYGFLPTPALSHETRSRGLNCGIMITASHNPPEYNGFKVFNSDGEAFDDETTFPTNNEILERNQLSTRVGKAETCAPEQYENALSGMSLNRSWKVVLDPGNGATSDVAPRVYARVLAKVTAINCIRETDFSSRGSEPTKTSMRMLCAAVAGSGADAGVGLDGDGDRMFMIDERGICHLQDRVLAAFVASLSTRSKGPFVVPLDASMAIDEVAKNRGAKLVRGPVGDAKLLREMKAVGGTFAGEPSGAWIHPQFNPCPDGILSGLLFLKAVEQDGRTVSQVIEEVPEYHMIRESLSSTRTDMGKTGDLSQEMEKIVGQDAKTSNRFGLRVRSDNSWVLVRKSGTEPVLRITAESKIRKEAARIMRETIRILRRAMKGTA